MDLGPLLRCQPGRCIKDRRRGKKACLLLLLLLRGLHDGSLGRQFPLEPLDVKQRRSELLVLVLETGAGSGELHAGVRWAREEIGEMGGGRLANLNV